MVSLLARWMLTKYDDFVTYCRGKHYPAYFRESNQVKHMKDVNYGDIMPVVMMRDPYTWMQVRRNRSMAALPLPSMIIIIDSPAPPSFYSPNVDSPTMLDLITTKVPVQTSFHIALISSTTLDTAR